MLFELDKKIISKSERSKKDSCLAKEKAFKALTERSPLRMKNAQQNHLGK